MQICVYGLWHLGSVTAACLAQHFSVVGVDSDSDIVAGLARGVPPIAEPGLPELVSSGLEAGNLRFSSNLQEAVKNADVVWVTFDTPVDDDDVADVGFVRDRVRDLFPHLRNDALVIISSQVPVGFTAEMEKAFSEHAAQRRVAFAYSPENLRLGKAIDVFRNPDRVVVGVRSAAARETLSQLFTPFTTRIEWMSVESAEMTKHALNAFLATSVSFINELATLCERVGADAKEVERGLKSEARIGPRSYLGPGAAFAGGTLARDVNFLSQVGERVGISTPLFHAVAESNEIHKGWLRRRITDLLGPLTGKTITVLGLTYKPGTDTLRRSSAVEFCRWARQQGAAVRAYDPAVRQLPPDFAHAITTCHSALDAASDADAVVIATEWPEFRSLSPDDLCGRLRRHFVLDPNRFLAATLGADRRFQYAAVGQPLSHP